MQNTNLSEGFSMMCFPGRGKRTITSQSVLLITKFKRRSWSKLRGLRRIRPTGDGYGLWIFHQKWGCFATMGSPLSPDSCPRGCFMCCEKEESMIHLFLECSWFLSALGNSPEETVWSLERSRKDFILQEATVWEESFPDSILMLALKDVHDWLPLSFK